MKWVNLFKNGGTLVESVHNPTGDYIYYYMGVSIRFLLNSQYHRIWVNLNQNQWLKIYEKEISCQGCTENQPNQTAHSCLGLIVLDNTKFNYDIFSETTSKIKCTDSEFIELIEKIINRHSDV